MRAGPAFLQFDWSKASLSMDLPVFVYSHMKTSFIFLSRQRKYTEAFYVVTDLLLQATQRQPYRALVLSRQARKLGPYFRTSVLISYCTKSKLG